MPELSPAQMTAEIRRLNEECEELRGIVGDYQRLKQAGMFTIKDICEMRGIDNPDDICDGCKGLGVTPPGSTDRCPHCGGSGSNKANWIGVLQ